MGHFLCSHPLPVLLQNLLRYLKTPMQKSLSHNRADVGVIVLRLGRENLVAELAAKTPLGSSRFEPSRDLPGIIRTTTALIEAAVPLEPPVRI